MAPRSGVLTSKNRLPPLRDDGQVSDFVDDQQRGPAQEGTLLAQLPLSFGLGESAEDVGKTCK